MLKQMSKKIFQSSLWGGVVALSLLTVVIPSAFASHIDWDARRAERAAEREARRIERAAERAAADEPECVCSARLSPAKPSLSFSNGVLTFTPRVNVDIRLRGDNDGEQHTVSVAYEGNSAYSSDDVNEPAGVNFSGQRTVLENASCEGHWNFGGIELARIPLTGITGALVGLDQELAGAVTMKTAVSGCGFAEENSQFQFRLQELGNIRVGSWRSVR